MSLVLVGSVLVLDIKSFKARPALTLLPLQDSFIVFRYSHFRKDPQRHDNQEQHRVEGGPCPKKARN